MTTRADLERAMAAAGLDAPAHWDEVTGSTNVTALELAEAGAGEWTLVAAGHQTSGRGRMGRTWQDRPGRALLFSVVLRPRLDPVDAGLLPLLAGATMAVAATQASGAEVLCKWPNDLLMGEAKLGGILSESAVQGDALRHAVIGIGVNLDLPPGVPDAASLGPSTEPMDLLTRFLLGFRAAYLPDGPGFAQAVVERWSLVSATLGRDVEAARTDGATIRGRAVALDAHGGLIVEGAQGRSTVAFGEVAHLS